jgi:bifunctional non-homologous end joining protein LigD
VKHGLAEYKRKRRFAATPEPEGGGEAGRRIFVVQLHHASHRHYDFRMEFDGVLKSWAVPKGPSFDPAVKRLALEVEDHPLSYANFEGDIPKGNYGAGHVDVFDHGTWEPIGNAHEGLGKGDLKFILHGDVLRGSWVLVRTRRQGTKNQWLLIKHRDEFAGPRDVNDFIDPKTDRPIALAKRKKTWPKRMIAKAPAKTSVKVPQKTIPGRSPALPSGDIPETLKNEAFAPELCRSLDAPPATADWLHEVKWDGYRIVATVIDGNIRLWSRNAIEWTAKVPQLVEAIRALNLDNAQLDGEMIVLRDGRDDFNALQARLSSEATDAPLVYVLFDVPHLNGQSLRNVPLIDRKAVLAKLLKGKPHALLRYSEHQIGNGRQAFAQATASGLEGIVSKRVDSFYRGARNGDWVKAKGRPSDEFIVMGFTEPRRSRAGIGALLLAQPRDGKLVYVGRVGTGLTDEQLISLRKQLQKDLVATPAADIGLMARPDQRLGIWVKPRLVVEAYFQGIGGQGLLRQPAFKTLRLDKTPGDLIMDAAKSDKNIHVAARKRAETRADAGAAKVAVSAKKPKSLGTKRTAKHAETKRTTPGKAVRAAHACSVSGEAKSAAKKSISETISASTARRSARSAESASIATRASKARSVSRAAAKSNPAGGSLDEAGVVITHPEREVFPDTGITKGDVAAYYRAVAPWLLPELANRPISVVRCPGGAGKACFFQKHVAAGWGDHVHGVEIEESDGIGQYLCIRDATGLLELVQMNVLEMDPWGAKASDTEHADRIVFDLDPHPTVKWSRVAAGARDVRAQLESIGLQSFLRGSGKIVFGCVRHGIALGLRWQADRPGTQPLGAVRQGHLLLAAGRQRPAEAAREAPVRYRLPACPSEGRSRLGPGQCQREMTAHGMADQVRAV